MHACNPSLKALASWPQSGESLHTPCCGMGITRTEQMRISRSTGNRIQDIRAGSTQKFRTNLKQTCVYMRWICEHIPHSRTQTRIHKCTASHEWQWAYALFAWRIWTFMHTALGMCMYCLTRIPWAYTAYSKHTSAHTCIALQQSQRAWALFTHKQKWRTCMAPRQHMPYSCRHKYAHTCIALLQCAIFMHAHTYACIRIASQAWQGQHKPCSCTKFNRSPHVHASPRSHDCKYTPYSCAQTKETKVTSKFIVHARAHSHTCIDSQEWK